MKSEYELAKDEMAKRFGKASFDPVAYDLIELAMAQVLREDRIRVSEAIIKICSGFEDSHIRGVVHGLAVSIRNFAI